MPDQEARGQTRGAGKSPLFHKQKEVCAHVPSQKGSGDAGHPNACVSLGYVLVFKKSKQSVLGPLGKWTNRLASGVGNGC